MEDKYRTYDSWLDCDVYDSTGNKIGGIDHIVQDDRTGRPEFVAVNTGLFGMKTTFVPIRGSRWDGDHLVVPWTKDQIKDAPNVEGDDWLLDPVDERRLFDHYAFDYENPNYGVTRERADTGFDISPQVTTRTTGREKTADSGLRLRRYKVQETAHIETDVPIEREEVRVEKDR